MDDNQPRGHLRRDDFRAAKKHVIFAQWAASRRPKLFRQTKSAAAILDAIARLVCPADRRRGFDSGQARLRQGRQRTMSFL